MAFVVSSEEHKKIGEWLDNVVYPAILKKQTRKKNKTIYQDEFGKFYPDVGSIGGSLTYKFTPTSIGTILEVEHVSGAKLDLTDYTCW